MPRSDFHHTPLTRCPGWSQTFAGLVAILTSQVAFGHTLLITRGEVIVEDCRASVELDVAVEDFLHWYGVGADSHGHISVHSLKNILERHALALHRILVIRDASGSPLPSEPFSFSFDWPAESHITIGDLQSLRVRYSTRFSYPSAPRFLTFQLWMGSDNPSVYWQTILSVHGTTTDGGGVIRLTSRGNAETIELRWSDKHASLVPHSGGQGVCPNEGVAGLKQICADITFGTESVDVRISIPLVLLQTWIVPRKNDDEFLDPDEQKSTRIEMESLLASALSIESEGRKYFGDITGVEFLPIDAKDPSAQVRPVSLLTGRAIARLRFGPFSALKQADVQWKLFNSAVFSAIAIIGGSDPAERHEFTSFQRDYRWHSRF